jgi:autotransporter-associated beta strand protein
MEPEIWQLARKTANSLNLSTSQFISRLIEETDGAIQYKGLLELRKHKSEADPDPHHAPFPISTQSIPTKPPTEQHTMKTNTAFPTLLATSLLRRVVFPLLALLSVSSVAFAQNGVFSWAGLGSGNQDANVGLTNTKTYLNAVDAGGWGGTVNGVTFARGNFNSNPSGSNYAVTGAGSTFFRDPINLGGELGKVVLDFVHGSGSSTQTVTLSGLTAGEFYTTTFYNFAWDNNSRAQAITTTGGASTTFNQNFNGQNNANVLRYGFVASGTNEAITFTPVNAGATFHNSAFTTEQAFNKTYVSGGDWTTAAWSTAGAPNAVGANADFTAQAAPTTLNLNAAQTVGNLRFAGTNGWTVSGSNTLTLQADVGGRAILAATSGTHTIATPTDWSSDLWVSGAGRLELSGQVGTTSRGLTKSGVGTLVLSGSNAFSGVTDITAGTLVAANDAALGAGGHDQSKMTWIRDGATLALQGNISSGEHFHVWGSGVGGLGAIRNLSGNNALTNVDGSGPGYALRSQTTVGVDAGSLSVSGFYESGGSYGLTTIGAGTLILTANSTYTGTTTISGGTLQVGNGGTSGALGSGNVLNNATLALNRSDNTIFSNAISGSGVVVKKGFGDVTFTGANTSSGGLMVSQGLTWAGSAANLGSGTITLGDATTGTGGRSDAGLLIDNAVNTTIANDILVTGAVGDRQLGGYNTGGSAANTWTGTITLERDLNLRAWNTTTRSSFDGQITGTGGINVTQGRVTLGNTGNDYTGATTVNAGTILQANANEVLPNATALTVNGTLRFYTGGGTETVGTLSGNGTIESIDGPNTLIEPRELE